LKKHLEDHILFPGELEEWMASLAIRCLAKVPSERPAHAGEVAAAVTAALTRTAESHRQAELNQARLDGEMGYGKQSRFGPGLRIMGMLLLLGLVWFFGYAYRAMTVEEARWTEEKEKQLQLLQKTGRGQPGKAAPRPTTVEEVFGTEEKEKQFPWLQKMGRGQPGKAAPR
jgi:hypothetical protein